MTANERIGSLVLTVSIIIYLTYPYYTNLVKKFQHCAGSKN